MIAFANAPSYVNHPVAVVLTTTEQKKVNLEGHMCTASVILVAPPQCNTSILHSMQVSFLVSILYRKHSHYSVTFHLGVYSLIFLGSRLAIITCWP